MVAPRPRRNRHAVPIADLLTRFMHQKGWSRAREHRAVFGAWESIVPENIARRTRPVSFRGGTLLVIVTSAPLMEELRCFRADEFLGLLNRELELQAAGVTVNRVEFRGQ